ncbi:MAG: ATP-binding protein [Chloroflexota bacterium]
MTTAGKRFELKVESRLDSLPAVADFVDSSLRQLSADPSAIPRVQLVVDEAITNVIKHAYAGGHGHVTIVFERSGNDLVITIHDRGRPFDPTRVAPPDLDSEVEARRVGGLGIHFMKTLMDEVHHRSDPEKGNELVMKKRLWGLGVG